MQKSFKSIFLAGSLILSSFFFTSCEKETFEEENTNVSTEVFEEEDLAAKNTSCTQDLLSLQYILVVTNGNGGTKTFNANPFKSVVEGDVSIDVPRAFFSSSFFNSGISRIGIVSRDVVKNTTRAFAPGLFVRRGNDNVALFPFDNAGNNRSRVIQKGQKISIFSRPNTQRRDIILGIGWGASVLNNACN